MCSNLLWEITYSFFLNFLFLFSSSHYISKECVTGISSSIQWTLPRTYKFNHHALQSAHACFASFVCSTDRNAITTCYTIYAWCLIEHDWKLCLSSSWSQGKWNSFIVPWLIFSICFIMSDFHGDKVSFVLAFHDDLKGLLPVFVTYPNYASERASLVNLRIYLLFVNAQRFLNGRWIVACLGCSP